MIWSLAEMNFLASKQKEQSHNNMIDWFKNILKYTLKGILHWNKKIKQVKIPVSHTILQVVFVRN